MTGITPSSSHSSAGGPHESERPEVSRMIPDLAEIVGAPLHVVTVPNLLSIEQCVSIAAAAQRAPVDASSSGADERHAPLETLEAGRFMDVAHRIVERVAEHWPRRVPGAGASLSLQRAFVITYDAATDNVAHLPHADPADFTINICLSDECGRTPLL